MTYRVEPVFICAHEHQKACDSGMAAKRGRPKKLTDAVKKDILAGVALGQTQARAALAAGIGESTISDAKRNDPAFSAALKEAETVCERQWLQHLVISEKGWQRFAWLLERKFPKIWGKHVLDESSEAGKRLLEFLQGDQSADSEDAA